MRRVGRNIAVVAAALLGCGTPAAAQLDGNSDEAQVAPYTLPDPLIASDGRRVATAQDWRKRRAELIALFEANIYGVAPKPRRQRYIVEEQGSALGGLAVRRQITILLDGRSDGPRGDHSGLIVSSTLPGFPGRSAAATASLIRSSP